MCPVECVLQSKRELPHNNNTGPQGDSKVPGTIIQAKGGPVTCNES